MSASFLRLQLRLGAAGLIGAVLVLTIVVGLRLNPGWLWILAALAMLGLEFDRRQRWARAGYPGDPRAAIDWDADADPAYEFQAIAHFQAKEYSQAKQLLDKALDLKPHDPFVLYHLACAEARTGEPEAALEHLREATAASTGYMNYLKLAQRDKDFVSIRDDPRFPRLAG